MNPRLHIIKVKTAKDYTTKRYIRFAVVDSDRNKTYPANFICMLPQHLSIDHDDSSVFARTFGDSKMDLAKKLLTKALETEDDLEIKAEIQDRLKTLKPKPAWQPKKYF